jgi:hypothetical protein
MVSTGVPPVMILMLGISKLGTWASTNNEVVEAVFSAVHQEVEMREKVYSDEGMCDVGQDERSREIPP